jgi:hypothetical protein
MRKAEAAPSTGRGPGTGRGAFTVRLQLLMLNGSLLLLSSKSSFQVPLPLSPMKALNGEEGKKMPDTSKSPLTTLKAESAKVQVTVSPGVCPSRASKGTNSTMVPVGL